MKIAKFLVSAASLLVLLLAGAAGWLWWQMRGSLPQLDGSRATTGLGAPVRIERDDLGVPTVTAVNRLDAARALGFLHAQDRYFQMDLLRRTAAGELAELFGRAALPHDRQVRVHQFRTVARKAVELLETRQRALLEAYAAGVNAGLHALARRPWEYLLLRTEPAPWRLEDSILVAHAMWLDLQDHTGRRELSRGAVQQTLGLSAVEFFSPRGNEWDSALDGSMFPPPPLPAIAIRRGETAAATPAAAAAPEFLPGSNSFAVAGAHTANGAALVENDMHLGLRVPNVWYRAVLAWTGPGGAARRVVGVTLPGTPFVVAGSNGRVAWGFTNSYVDTTDVVLVETESDAQIIYRTERGWQKIDRRNETIAIRGGASETLEVLATEWGPIIGPRSDGRAPALAWTAHDPAATNLTLCEMEDAASVDEALAIAHRAGMPNQNLVAGDTAGNIAWTVTGLIPRRVGFDGRLPVSWAYGDRHWDGYLPPDEVPVIRNPAEGLIWTANQRLVGGDALAKLGNGGYGRGARGGQIRDDLRALVASGVKATPPALLSIALDDRAVFLSRWRTLLLATLTDDVVARHDVRAELRDAVRNWTERASANDAGYRIVGEFRRKVAERVCAPLFRQVQTAYERFHWTQLSYESAVWRLTEEKPLRLLGSDYATWDELLVAAVDDVLADIDKAGVAPGKYTWGRRNILRMRHPLSLALPGPLGRWLDMPAEPLPGDNDMPRVQDPENGASERFVISPGHEQESLFHMPGGQSGHPLSPYYRAGHEAWAQGKPAPLLPGPVRHTLTLTPQ